MNIVYGDKFKEIKRIVDNKSKFQKVMVIYDETISNIDIMEIYETVKSDCVFNKIYYKEFDNKEIFNGYRLILYFMQIDNFLKLNFNKEEFINVFIPVDDKYLPYFINNNQLNSEENFLIVDKQKIDLSMISSVNFNLFFNYFKNLLEGNSGYEFLFKNDFNSITLEKLNEFDEEMFFLDLDLISKEGINYEDLLLVDLLLIDAFIILITSIKSNNYMVVDFYKSLKEDDDLIDKFYKLLNDKTINEVIILNYNCLYNFSLKIKNKLIEIISCMEIDKNKIETLIKKIKHYSKNSNNLMVYLYLYNIFNV